MSQRASRASAMAAHESVPGVPIAGVIPAIGPDGRLYPIGKMRAHREAVFHLAVSVFVFDGEGRLLIQRRAREKYHCGGQWANTCCTHPHWGETAATCASRRLTEELGFIVDLVTHDEVEYSADVGNGLHEHERVTLFSGVADPAMVAAAVVNPDEVMATRWVSAAQLHEDIAADPASFTPWFRIYLERFPDLKF